MAEQLYRKCPECDGAGGQNSYTDMGSWTVPRFVDCLACFGTGYLPVDAPEPLTGEERKRMLEGLPASCDDEWGPADYVDSFIAAMPARFGVRMEGTTDET